MEHRSLEINLQSAMDLNKVNLFTKMDVYAVVSISGGDMNQIQKTKSPVDHVGDANPTWNFTMKFTLDEALLQTNRLVLDFKLVCQRALGDKDVGEVNVPIKELFDSVSKGGATADSKQIGRYQVRKPSGKPKGELTFSYQFGEKTVAAVAPAPTPAPYGSAIPYGKPGAEPVTAYPSGSSSAYPPVPAGAYPPMAYPGPAGGSHYPPPVPYGKVEDGGHYPPPASGPPPPVPYNKVDSDGHYPPPPGAYPPPPPGAYGYPPPPGYGYPPPPPSAGYGYHPPPPGYGYAGPPVQQPAPKKNKFGLGLGAGLLGGAIGGMLVGDMISDAGDFDGGGFDF